jgi:hypothetical protein
MFREPLSNFKKIIKSPLFWVFFIIIFTRFITIKTVLVSSFENHDMDNYYSYLPTFITHHDWGFTKNRKGYWLEYFENGRACNKYTMGVALIELPGYLTGIALEKITGNATEGYGPLYLKTIVLFILGYVLTGYFFLWKVLLRFATPLIAGFTLLALFFCSNLYCYTFLYPFMPHASMFALNCILIYLTIRWYESAKIKHLYLIALLFGLSVLIRPSNFTVAIIPALWGVFSFNTLKQRILFWKKLPLLNIMIAMLLFLLPYSLQILHWKYVTGEFLYDGYNGESFFLSDPKLFKQWFSFRTGWLIYSPFMVFSVFGFITLYRYFKPAFYSIVIYTVVTFYLLSCWWAWSFAGSFGMRAYIDSYGFLAIPLATFLNYCKIRKVVISGLAFLAVTTGIMNIVQTSQYKITIIHWSDNTFETYKLVFMKKSLTDEERALQGKMLVPYDIEKAKKGERNF